LALSEIKCKFPFSSIKTDAHTNHDNGAPAQTVKLAQDWIATDCSEFISKDEWPPNSSDLSPLDYHVWGTMLERYVSPKAENNDELKKVLQLVWNYSCHMTRSTEPRRSHREDFELVWILVVDTSNICLNELKSVFLDNKNYNLVLIIPRKIEKKTEHMAQYTAITLQKTEIIFFKLYTIVSEFLSYKWGNLGVKKSHTVVEKLHFVRSAVFSHLI